MGNRYLNVVWLSGEPSFRHKPTGSVACFATTTTTAMDEPEPPELFPEQIHHFGETNLTSAGGLTLLQIFLSMIPEVKKVGIRGKCSRYVVQSSQWRLLISPFLVWFSFDFCSPLCAYVRGNMDSIKICILRRAICILQKFLCNMDIDSKPFLFRKKESILHRNMHNTRILHVAICILR